jgi:hypothetical protein
MPNPPKIALFDPNEVASLLMRAARGMAFNMNFHAEWEEFSDMWVANWALDLVNAALLREKVHFGAVAVDGNYAKVKADTQQLYQLFCSNFVRFASESPAKGMAYLKEKEQQAKFAWDAMNSKFDSARRINSEVVRELNRSLYRTMQTKVACEFVSAAVGSFCPVNWVAAVLIGTGYTVVTETIQVLGEVDRGQMFGWQRATKLGKPAANLVLGYGQTALQEGANHSEETADILLRQAESMAAKKRVEIQRILSKAGGAAENKAARKGVAQAANRVENAMARVGVAQANAGAAKALAGSCKVVGFGIQLLFMKDDIEATWVHPIEPVGGFSDR